MGESRNVYVEPDERAVIRTADVYQTEVEAGTAGYSDTLLSVVANFKNSGAPEGFNAQCMVGKSKRGEVALRLFAVIDPETETFVRAGFKARGCLAMTACASVVCSMIEGRTFAEALAITPDDVKAALDHHVLRRRGGAGAHRGLHHQPRRRDRRSRCRGAVRRAVPFLRHVRALLAARRAH